ncbi:hypothetical protein PIB30_101160 [Stylosanthes scabra]|uniref:Uncharacterized protein n=1 Tax=Stylosanthes scabra TaxID=79078 RepID=A0ABU6ZW73_9FABA|nr:hypothetical protein [Stylosanthes scabra]
MSKLHNLKRDSTMIQSHTRPRLCVDRVTPDHAYAWIESQPDHAYAWKTLCWQQTQDPRIGVKFHAYAWKAHSSHILESYQTTHMLGGSVIHAMHGKHFGSKHKTHA